MALKHVCNIILRQTKTSLLFGFHGPKLIERVQRFSPDLCSDELNILLLIMV